MEESIVRVEHLSHRYSVQWAVRDVSFEIPRRGIYGLLGSNGAGKSTVMNIMCGVLKQTEGDVIIADINTKQDTIAAKRHIGFLPQKPPLYGDLTVEEYLTHAADLRWVAPREVKKAVDEVLERCAISHFRKRLLKNLSGGYQQRVGIAQAIVHKPDLVVFDEPTNGLDPNQILEVRQLIKDIAVDRTVMLSTHILSEVQATCSSIKMIEHGRVVFSGSTEDFDNYIAPDSFIIELNNSPGKEVLVRLAPNKGVEALSENRFRIFFNEDNTVTEKYVEASVMNDWNLKELVVERCSLDQIFAQLSGKVK